MMKNKDLRSLRNYAWAEGASFLVLLLIAMPLKYLAGQPLMVRVVGMLHGILFLLFLAELLRVRLVHGWPAARVFKAVAISLIPAAPFFIERMFNEEPSRK